MAAAVIKKRYLQCLHSSLHSSWYVVKCDNKDFTKSDCQSWGEIHHGEKKTEETFVSAKHSRNTEIFLKVTLFYSLLFEFWFLLGRLVIFYTWNKGHNTVIPEYNLRGFDLELWLWKNVTSQACMNTLILHPQQQLRLKQVRKKNNCFSSESADTTTDQLHGEKPKLAIW